MEIRMTSVKSKLQVAMVLAVTVIVYAAIVIVGLRGSLNGDFDQYLLPGGIFAAPSNIESHGFTNKVLPPISGGFDGQFYYYHSDDPLLLKDTLQHLDMPSYRAQRVGVPMLAFSVSRIFGMDWVSPSVYFIVSVSLLLIATLVMSNFLVAKGYPPYSALLWSVGGSALYTVAFGFVDGSADALLITSIILYLNKKQLLYIIVASLAVLSKESYIIIPVIFGFISFVLFIIECINKKYKFSIVTIAKLVSPHIVPVLIAIAWQAYLYIHVPKSMYMNTSGAGMLGAPFVDAVNYMISSFNGVTVLTIGDSLKRVHPLYRLGFGLLLFLMTIVYLLFFSVKNSISEFLTKDRQNYASAGLIVSLLFLSVVYSCLGKIQVWEPVGFVKAISLLIAIYVMYQANVGGKLSPIIVFTSICLAIYSFIVIYDRTSVSNVTIANTTPEWAKSEPICLKSANASIDLISLNPYYPDTILNRLIMPKRYIATVKIKNKSDYPLSPFKGKGTTNAGYQWFSNDASTLMFDGGRVPLPRTLLNGESEEVSFLVNPPTKSGSYTLRLTLVQEGCSWLYNINPAIKHDLKMEM